MPILVKSFPTLTWDQIPATDLFVLSSLPRKTTAAFSRRVDAEQCRKFNKKAGSDVTKITRMSRGAFRRYVERTGFSATYNNGVETGVTLILNK